MRYSCVVYFPTQYFWLMFETLFFYLFLAFIICYFFRKYCQDPAVVKQMQEEERLREEKEAAERGDEAKTETADGDAPVIGEPLLNDNTTPGERESEDNEKK